METFAFLALIISGLAWIVYGIALRVFKRELSLVFFWCVLALALALPGVLGLAGIWQSLPSLLHYAWLAALVLIFMYEAVFFALASRHFGDSGQPSLDYLVVLGARVFDHGPSAGFARRLETAKAYLESNPNTICIACGGRGDDEPVSEASCASMYLQERRVGCDRIILEDNSHNTSESLRNVAGIVDVEQDRIGIVTAGYHLFRALAIARWLGMASVIGISAGNPPQRTAAYLVRESLAMAKDAATLTKSRKR